MVYNNNVFTLRENIMYHVILNENYVKSKKAKRKFDDVLRVFEQAGKPYTVHRTANKESVRSVTA